MRWKCHTDMCEKMQCNGGISVNGCVRSMLKVCNAVQGQVRFSVNGRCIGRRTRQCLCQPLPEGLGQGDLAVSRHNGPSLIEV
jgi:hypothetical protein